MIGFGATAIVLQNHKVAAGFQIFNAGCFNIVPPVVKMAGMCVYAVKNRKQLGINFVMQIGKMGAPVMICLLYTSPSPRD